MSDSNPFTVDDYNRCKELQRRLSQAREQCEKHGRCGVDVSNEMQALDAQGYFLGQFETEFFPQPPQGAVDIREG